MMKKNRKNSASGGIASEIYKFCVKNNIVAYGVELNPQLGCRFIRVKSTDDISRVSNSKYVFSDTDDTFSLIKNELKNDHKAIFIGLPCQVAGLRKYVGELGDKLCTIDLICHGIAPWTYLKQHIKSIEEEKRKKCDKLYFRDPTYGTEKYFFSLCSSSERKPFYKKRVNEDDIYQLGYHSSLIYRENCYHCHYAKRDRASDLTIGDFNGVGFYGNFPYSKKSVSCILQNTIKGLELLKNLDVTLVERNPNEAFDFERQLNSPSHPHLNRGLFVDSYRNNGDFIHAASLALEKQIKKNRMRSILKINQLKDFTKKLIPQHFIDIIKKSFRR